jgi:hypothetical protein
MTNKTKVQPAKIKVDTPAISPAKTYAQFIAYVYVHGVTIPAGYVIPVANVSFGLLESVHYVIVDSEKCPDELILSKDTLERLNNLFGVRNEKK